MKYKKIGFSLIGGLIFSSTPAMALPAFDGSWQVNHFPGPNRTAAQTYCIVFTTAANTLPGEPQSGTWLWRDPGAAPAAPPTWAGSWVQQGDQVKWWGNELNFISSYQGTLITTNASANSGSMTGNYQWFQPAIGNLAAVANSTSIGAWSAQRVPAC